MDALDVEFDGSFEGSFEPDAFYESFQAPKFHDFTAPEEPIDPDAFFKGKPGMLKKDAAFAEVIKAMDSPKINKIQANDAAKAPSSNQGSLQHQGSLHHPKTPVAAEKAVRGMGNVTHMGQSRTQESSAIEWRWQAVSSNAGSAKKVARGPVSTSLTPLTSKAVRNANSACNSPSGMMEKNGNGSLKPTSLMKKLQSCENDDPNPNSPSQNHSDATPTKAVKSTRKNPAIPSSEDKPLARSRSQKVLEPKAAAATPAVAAPTETGSSTCKDLVVPVQGDHVDKENTSDKAANVVSLKPETPGKASQKAQKSKSSAPANVIATVQQAKESSSSSVAVVAPSLPHKTPVKSVEPGHVLADLKKVAVCAENVGSPQYVPGHHCRSSRCAANDPNYNSPSSVPTKKYLIARRGTPGSIRHVATPSSLARSEVQNGEVPSRVADVDVASTCVRRLEDSLPAVEVKSSSEASDDSCVMVEPVALVPTVEADSSIKAQDPKEVGLEEVFQNLALDQKPVAQEEQQEAENCEIPKIDGEFKEVPLNETDNQSSGQQCEVVALDSVSTETIVSVSAADYKEAKRSEEEDASKPSSSEVKATETKLEGVELFLHVASDCLENIDMKKFGIPESKHGIKRKSQECFDVNVKRANCASDESIKSICPKVKELVAPCFQKLRKRVTSPRPFRLRTQERGILKEIEFNKKMEEYIAAKEGFNSAFQGLAVAEPKILGKAPKPGHVFCAKRAEPAEQDDINEDAKTAHKLMIPHAQKAPLFDRPFKPHRSTKKLTVPQEPKFHPTRGRRTCPTHPAVPA